MSDLIVLAPDRAARAASRLAAALLASRANACFPDVRCAAAHLQHAVGTLTVSAVTGLPTYETWARLRADWQVAREGAGNPPSAALRLLPPPRLGDLDVALRSAARSARRIHVTLDKVATDGRLLRLLADLTVDHHLKDAALLELLFDLLFPAADLPAELLLVRVLSARGVRAVERVSICAVDIFADVESSPGPAIDPAALALGVPGAVALSLAAATCATDITGGDNDLLGGPLPGDAAAVRARLGSAALPQRLYRDRKLVVNAAAAPLLEARARARATRTVLYPVVTT